MTQTIDIRDTGPRLLTLCAAASQLSAPGRGALGVNAAQDGGRRSCGGPPMRRNFENTEGPAAAGAAAEIVTERACLLRL